MIVDASVVSVAIADDTLRGHTAREALRGHDLAAPGLLDLEVLSTWRGLVRAGKLDEDRARLAVVDLAEFAIDRVPESSLISRIWELESNLSIYDAAYVALAENTGRQLLTADEKLARAPGLTCDIRFVANVAS